MPFAKLTPENINNLADYIESKLVEYSNLKAYSALGQEKTYAEIDILSAKFAAWLQSNTSLETGDRVAIQLPNIMQNPIAVYGVIRAGFVLVNTNPLYTPKELLHQLKDSGAKTLIILDELLPNFTQIKSQTQIDNVIITSATQLLDEKPLESEYPCFITVFNQSNVEDLKPRKAIRLEDTAVLQYTGGTTGISKGAELTHNNLLSNSIQTLERLGNSFKEGKEVIICPLPLYHIYAFTVCMMTFFARGALIVLIPNPRDMTAFVRLIKPYPFTAFAGLNTLFMGLCAHPEIKHCDFSHLSLTISGGTALTKSAADLWQATTGCAVTEGYGLSETAPVLTFNQPGYEVIGSVGPALVETYIQILDNNDLPLPLGQAGQIAAYGPQVMKGYWQRPDETAKVMTETGYFKTGDIGKILSDGSLQIVDRLKDMIIVSGFNVYPNEVEDALTQHTKILEAAVIGKPDEKTQEKVCAFVTVKEDVDIGEIIDFCKKSLTPYKIPKEISVIEELPKSAVGKILRRELRA